MSTHEEAPTVGASSSPAGYANPQAEVVCKTCGWFGLFTDVVLERGLEDNDEVCPECGSNNLEDLVDA